MMKQFLSAALTAFCLVSCSMKDDGVAITAHRGFWDSEAGGHSENSLAALRAAQDECFWGSEFDVHLTADSVVVVNHDATFHGRKIHTSPLDSLLSDRLPNGETIPTLDAYLDQGAASPRTVLVFELKQHESPEREDLLVDLSLAALEQHRLLDAKRVIFISFSRHMCQRLASRLPGFMVQYLNGDATPEELYAEGIMGLDYHFSRFDEHPEWVRQAHDLGMAVNAWTVNQEEDIRRMLGLGVDCITTNDPLRVRSLLEADPDLKERKIR